MPKLKASKQLLEGYERILNDQLSQGIIEEAQRTHGPEHFLPHHTVIGKKLRVVYDASSHIKDAKSLNSCLYPGPNLFKELAGILLRFRNTIEPIIADIKQAFLNKGLKFEDREIAKFLWFRDMKRPLTGSNILVFRFCRIAFGVVSSPFLLAATLDHHLTQSSSFLAPEIKANLYVDNLLLEAASAEEAAFKAKEAKNIFANAQMVLREFVARNPAATAGLPSEDILLDEKPSILYLKWNKQLDYIEFEFPEKLEGNITRRKILSSISSLFDPLGLCFPIILESKIFFQNLWDLKKCWDETIPEDEISRWGKIEEKWSNKIINFPRAIPTNGAISLQLHLFSDASPDAFAATAYLRAEFDWGVETNLI